MHTLKITQSLLYRARYIIGYTLIGAILVGMLVLASWQAPGGISEAEQAAAVTSSTLDLQDGASFRVLNLPYHVVQRAGFELLGISDLTIKLPSIILASLTAIGLVFLLRRWFRPNIAVLASLIAITTGEFIFVAQSGTASVLYMFWPTLILFVGTQVLRARRLRKLWVVLLGISVGLSLYTPLSIAIVAAIALTVLLHPHLRLALRKLPKASVLVALGAFLVTLVPLGYLIYHDTSFGMRLIGVLPSTDFQVVENIKTLLYTYFGFWLPNSSLVMTPIFGLGSVLLAVVGLYQVLRRYYSSQSHLILAWLLLIIPVQVIEPRFTTVLFIPIVLLIASGLAALVRYWYQLFPKNPYARVAGLLPLIVLVGTLTGSGLDRYFYGYRYDQTVSGQFSKDLRLLPADTTQLVVDERELDFYRTVAKYRSGLSVSTTPTGDRYLATRAAKQAPTDYEIDRIVTSAQYDDADRFYLYKKIAK